jgi:MarR family 2-MHQ and catechol resistance regulon transcriptional repressor
MYTAYMRLSELYRLGRHLQDVAEKAIGTGRTFDFSAAEAIVVGDLLDHGVSTISDVSSRTGFAQSRVSTVVAALRDRGWIETSVSEADRRRTQVAVGEEVRRRAKQARTRSATPVLVAALAGLSAESRDEVIAALEELQRALGAPGVDRSGPRPQVLPARSSPDRGRSATPAAGAGGRPPAPGVRPALGHPGRGTLTKSPDGRPDEV